MIVTRTPLRVSFAGGGSDLPAYTASARGTCVSMALRSYVWISVNRKFDGRVRVSYSRTENVETAAEVQHDLVRLAMLRMGVRNGVEITSVGDVHAGSGLGSSGAFCVGLVHALAAYTGESLSQHQLAEVATEVEGQGAGRTVGRQDQYAAAFGGLRRYRFNIDGTVEISEPLIVGDDLWHVSDSLLLFDSGRRRDASDLLRKTSDGLASFTDRGRIAFRMAAEAETLAEKLQPEGSVPESLLAPRVKLLLRDALQRGWALKNMLTPEATDLELGGMVERGLAAGAMAGKVVGAGGGGFLLFVVDRPNQMAVRQALADLRELQVQGDPLGSKVVLR